MPTYQYACTECGHGFEAVQSFSDDALTECPQCGGRLRKVFSSVGIVFKGSGFYRTDSREKAGAGKADGDGAGKADAAKTDGGTGGGDKGGAKPAAAGGSDKPVASPTPKPTTTATKGSSTTGSAA